MNQLIPTPDVIRRHIEERRAELRDLRRLLRIAERHHGPARPPEAPGPMKLETK